MFYGWHKHSDIDLCQGFTSKKNLPFRSDSDVISNFYPCNITYNSTSFASSEHEKCVILHHKKTVESILSAPTARAAKSIDDSVVSDSDYKVWIDHSESTMLKVLQFKARCHQSVHDALSIIMLSMMRQYSSWGYIKHFLGSWSIPSTSH